MHRRRIQGEGWRGAVVITTGSSWHGEGSGWVGEERGGGLEKGAGVWRKKGGAVGEKQGGLEKKQGGLEKYLRTHAHLCRLNSPSQHVVPPARSLATFYAWGPGLTGGSHSAIWAAAVALGRVGRLVGTFLWPERAYMCAE